MSKQTRIQNSKGVHYHKALRLESYVKGGSGEEKTDYLLKGQMRYGMAAAILVLIGFAAGPGPMLTDMMATVIHRRIVESLLFPQALAFSGFALFLIGIAMSVVILDEIQTVKKYTNLPITADQRKRFRKCRFILLTPIAFCVVFLLASIAFITMRTAHNPYVPDDYYNRPIVGKLTLVVDADDVPAIPDKMILYSLRPVVRGEDAMKLLARSFGIKAVHPYGHGPDYGFQDRSGRFFAYNLDSGYFLFREDRIEDRIVDDLSGVTLPETFPNKQRAAEIAMDALQHRGLLPDEAYIAGVSLNVGHDISNDGTTRYVWEILICRQINGFPVSNLKDNALGMSISVSVGDEGKLIAVRYDMSEPTTRTEIRTTSLSRAVADVENGDGTINLNPKEVDPVITNVSIAYNSLFKDENLWPVYVMSGPDAWIYVKATE